MNPIQKTRKNHQPQPPENEFPSSIQISVTQLADLLGLKPWALFQALLAVVGAAVGNSVKIRTSISPAPINLALSCVICQEGLCLLAHALDFLLQPLRDFQDSRQPSLGARARDLVEKELARLEAAQALALHCSDQEFPSPDNHPAGLAGLRRSLRKFVTVEEPGRLTRALQSSGDNAVVAVYRGAGFAKLLDANDPGVASERRLLRNGFLAAPFLLRGSASRLRRRGDT